MDPPQPLLKGPGKTGDQDQCHFITLLPDLFSSGDSLRKQQWISTRKKCMRIQEWVLRLKKKKKKDCVREIRPAVRSQNVREDDGYFRKPRRQRKRTVSSGFPSLHWLILPLRVCASEKGVCLNGFSSSSISDKLLSAGASRDLSALVTTVVQCFHLKNEQDGYQRQSFSEIQVLHRKKLDATKDVKRCIWGIQHCYLHFQELVISHNNHKYAPWWFCYLNKICLSNSNFKSFIFPDNNGVLTYTSKYTLNWTVSHYYPQPG